MKSKFIRLPDGCGIRIDTIRCVRVFMGSYVTSNTLTRSPMVGIDYSLPGENGQSHAFSHFGTEEDARAFADSVIAAIDEQQHSSRQADAMASQFHMSTPSEYQRLESLVKEAAMRRAMK